MKQFSNESLNESLQNYFLKREKFIKESKRISDQLGDIFGQTKNNRILNFKRRIFNQRNINPKRAPEEIKKIVLEYKKRYDKMNHLADKLENLFYQRELTEREELWGLFHSKDEIANPLPLVSHKMYDRLKKYLAEKPKEHRARVRKLDSTLLRVLARSTYKTSPFSSFTSFELKKFKNSDVKEEEKRLYIQEMNFYIFQKILQLLGQDKDFIPVLSYRFSGVSYNNQEMEFIIRYDINRGKIFNNIEQHFTLPINPIYKELATYNRSLSFKEVIKILSRYMNQEKVLPLFRDVFLKRGILYPDFELDEYEDDILTAFYHTIHSLNVRTQKKTIILEGIHNIIELFDQYKSASFKERFQIYSLIIVEIKKIGQALNHSFLKESIFYEDYVIKNSKDSLNVDSTLLKDISYVQKLAVLTSVPLQFKYEFAKKYYDLYKNRSLPVLCKEIRDLYLEEVMKFDTWANVLAPVEDLQSQGAKTMENIKGDIRDHLFALKRKGRATTLKKDKIEEWFSLLQQKMKIDLTPLSSTVLFQKSGNEYVLNKLYAGNLKLFIRYFQFEQEIYEDKDFQQYVEKNFPKNMLEIREGFGFNANHHERFIRNRLMIPFSKTHQPDEELKQSKNLLYTYNPKTEMVDIVDQKEPEVPLNIDFIGSLVDYMLPPSIRMLTTTISPRFDSRYFDLWEFKENSSDVVIDHVPRISLGMLTIIREKWLLSVKELKKYLSSSSYESYKSFLALFNHQNLPLEFFVSKYIREDEFDFESANRAEMKPLYMSMYSPLFFKEFIRFIKNERYVIIEEFHPRRSHETHNTEYQIEVNLR